MNERIVDEVCYGITVIVVLLVVGSLAWLSYVMYLGPKMHVQPVLAATPLPHTRVPIATAPTSTPKATSTPKPPTVTPILPTRTPQPTATVRPTLAVPTATPVTTWHEIARWEDDDIWSATTDGYVETRLFRILSDEWRISWETWPGLRWGEGPFWFFTCDGTGEPIEKSVETGGRDKGMVVFDRGGTFCLAIGTLQPYRIVVEAKF